MQRHISFLLVITRTARSEIDCEAIYEGCIAVWQRHPNLGDGVRGPKTGRYEVDEKKIREHEAASLPEMTDRLAAFFVDQGDGGRGPRNGRHEVDEEEIREHEVAI